jgi:hypothetical protein
MKIRRSHFCFNRDDDDWWEEEDGVVVVVVVMMIAAIVIVVAVVAAAAGVVCGASIMEISAFFSRWSPSSFSQSQIGLDVQ